MTARTLCLSFATLLAAGLSSAPAAAACPSSLSTPNMVRCLNNQLGDLEDVVDVLEAENAELRAYLSVDTVTDSVVFSGANVYIQSGSGTTDDDRSGYLGDGVGSLTGLGNLIIGYDEDDGEDDKSGSHNLVLGFWNSYSSYGGVISGVENAITAPTAAAIGGSNNEVSGDRAVILGGQSSVADGYKAAILGGRDNTASGSYSTVYGGNTQSATTSYDYAP